jgi:alkanesulfonate monooxygenase SsuD/methylene tetrahydromethanopterin reductase-like flavin-dependent oxidoreductase (luciferase family)
VQAPHPPVVVGGNGRRRTPAIAARFADEFNMPPFEGLDATRAAFDRVRTACETIARDPETLDLSVTLTTVCGRDRDELERRGAVSPAQFAAADLSGTPDQIVDRLASWAELGTTRAYLRVLDLRDVDHVELLRDVVSAAASMSTPRAGT